MKAKRPSLRSKSAKPPRFVSGEEWRTLRVKLDYSQVQAADLVGVDETTVQRWESGFTKRVRWVYFEKLRDSKA